MNRIPLLLSLLLALGCEKDFEQPEPEPIRPVRVQRVTASGGADVRLFAGRIKAGTETKLSFKTGGTVTKLRAKVGDRIEKGQTVATLEALDQSLQVQSAQASVAQIHAQLANAKAQYGRVKALYENNNATRSDLDTARTTVASAEASLQAASKQVQLAQSQAGKTVLKSPVTGVVATVSVEAGENVNPGQPVLVLNSGGQVEVEAPVPETLISKVSVGMPATVRVDALGGKRLPASVSEVAVTPGQTATTYPVTATLAEEDQAVRPGMAAQLELSFGEASEQRAIYVNPKAVGEDRSGRFVFVAVPQDEGLGTVKKKQVVVGKIGSRGLGIERGLEAGEWLVTAGISHLVDGKQVRLPGEVFERSRASPKRERGKSKSPTAAPSASGKPRGEQQ